MDSPAAYKPWTPVEHIDVPVNGHPAIHAVQVPWAAAGSAKAVIVCATIVAGEAMKVWLMLEQEAREAAREQGTSSPIAELYDPPLVRFRCQDCNDTWDAWVNDDGTLQDKRDAFCGNNDCGAKGKRAQVDEEES